MCNKAWDVEKLKQINYSVKFREPEDPKSAYLQIKIEKENHGIFGEKIKGNAVVLSEHLEFE